MAPRKKENSASAAALGKEGIGRHGFCNPGVSADCAAGSDYGFAAQYRGVRIDCHVVFYSRMPFFVHQVLFYAESTKGYALVDFYVVAYDAGFAYYDACSVVDEEAFADFSPRVYVYSGLTVGMLAHDAGDYGNAGLAEEMGYAVGCDGLKAGVGDYYLLRRLCGRVTDVGSLHVQSYLAAEFRNFFYQSAACLFRQGKAVGLFYHVVLYYVDQGLFYLTGEYGNYAVHAFAGHKAQVLGVKVFCNPEAGKYEALYVAQHIHNVFAVGKVVGLLQVYSAVLFVGLKNVVDCAVY